MARKYDRSRFRKLVKADIEHFANYPQGSYGHGRYLYLKGDLKDLGKKPRALQDLDEFKTAAVEVDHAPHDGSQRAGLRVLDPASMHRVAVPLPRGWHRRHKTTHGPGATRQDTLFSQTQTNLVHSNQYADALHNHLLDTFHGDAIGASGVKKIEKVAHLTVAALQYAQSPIPVKIHPHHVAGTPAITAAQVTIIRNALRARLDEHKNKPGMANLHNPF